jgi:8-oxo-dGTP pyrophosphatase MutT (NUDIX family)
MESRLVALQDAIREHGISQRTMFRIVKQHGLRRFKLPGSNQTYVDRQDLAQALRPQLKAAPHPGITPQEERMQTEDGRNVMVAAVVPHPDGYPEILVSVRVRGDEKVYSWIGGHVHRDETPEQAVIRELREELVIDRPRVVRTLERIDLHLDASRWWGPRFSDGYLSFNLLVDVGSAEIEVIDYEELKEVRWVPLEELIADWTAKLPPALRDPAIRSATEAVNERAAQLRTG